MLKQIATLVLATLVTAAHAKTLEIECGKTSEVVAMLTRYNEEPIVKMDYPEKSAPSMVLFANSSTETWTIVYAEVKRGESCVVASGVGINVVNPQKRGTSL